VQNKNNIKILCNNFRQCEIISLMKENIPMVFLLNVIIICFNLLSHCFLSEHYFGCVCEDEYLMHFLLIYLIFLCMLNVCFIKPDDSGLCWLICSFLYTSSVLLIIVCPFPFWHCKNPAYKLKQLTRSENSSHLLFSAHSFKNPH
jgi:hypothetical protein